MLKALVTCLLTILTGACGVVCAGGFTLSPAWIISLLGLLCGCLALLVLELRRVRLLFVQIVRLALAALTAVALGSSGVPLIVVLLVMSCYSVLPRAAAAGTATAGLVAVVLVLQPAPAIAAVTVFGAAAMFSSLLAFSEMDALFTRLNQVYDRLHTMEALLADQRNIINDVQRDVRVAERNRIAARIHDSLGHGVTGSIMQLEASLAIWQSNPDKAHSNVLNAVSNLRSSMDSIRGELRDEHNRQELHGLSRFVSQMEEFERTSGIEARLSTSGPLEDIPAGLWVCLERNLTETLTNLLRHAPQTTRFTADIKATPYILEATFADDGTASTQGATERAPAGVRTSDRSLAGHPGSAPDAATLKGGQPPGLGLVAIQERCLLCGGTAVFNQTPDGFSTHMVFRLKDGTL